MKDVSPAAIYAALLPDLVKAARDVGYALSVHGSLARDLDVVGVPWTEEAGTAQELIMRLLSVSGGYLADGGRSNEKGELVRDRGDLPTVKPHGRLAWTIHLGSGAYIDISVMPRQPKEVASP
jgi:hypothetical protein